MKKSDLRKDYLDKKHEQFMEDYKNLFNLMIGLILAYIASNIYTLGIQFQLVFFDGFLFVFYLMILARIRLERVRKDIMKIKLD